MKIYAVIMAGGVGSRFWPRSRERKPKQLLSIFGQKTMIQQTVDRLLNLIEPQNILIITNALIAAEISEQLPSIPLENIIAEPFGRNTAPCIALASLIVKQKDPDAVTVVLPADHLIAEEEVFLSTLKNAAEFAYESKGLVTIGIPPSRPETGYGYIQISNSEVTDNIYMVNTFAEKPNYATAMRFLESGDFMWNSGMFIWRADVILNEIRNYLPDLYNQIITLEKHIGKETFDEAFLQVYGVIKGISIDYGIMEKSSQVYLTKGKFSWNDVGSWEEVYQLSDKEKNGNVVNGDVFTQSTIDSYIYSPDKFTAVIGLENVLVINQPDSLLICRRDLAQDVKKIVDHLKQNEKLELL